jgi:hypothetical protein
MRQHRRYALGLHDTLSPGPFLHRANNQIRIANRSRIRPAKEFRESMLDFMFLPKQEVTDAIAPTGIVECNQM